VAEEGAYVAALVTMLTPELVREGQAREFVRRVQDLRKTANLDVADRIHIFVETSRVLQEAIEAHRDYVAAETLAVSAGLRRTASRCRTSERTIGWRGTAAWPREGVSYEAD